MWEFIKRHKIIIAVILLFLAWKYDQEQYGYLKSLLKSASEMAIDLKKELK